VNRNFEKVVAGLKDELRSLYRNGLGEENPRDEDINEVVQNAADEVFGLYARIKLADELGIKPWLICEMTSSWPDTISPD
jgi:hypothetical protein